MAKFEVHIPAVEPGGFNLTLKVGADNWMAALKAGMQKLGEQGAVNQNVMVDIQEDNSIHVTEPASGRVFRIRELSEEEATTAKVKRPSGIQRNPLAAKPQQEVTSPIMAAKDPSKTDTGVKPVSRGDEKTIVPGGDASRALSEVAAELAGKLKDTKSDKEKTQPPPSSSEVKTQPPPSGAYTGSSPSGTYQGSESAIRRRNKSSPKIELKDVEELEQPVKPVTKPIGRQRNSPGQAAQLKQSTEDMLADVFMRIIELEKKPDLEAAMEFILDLAMEKVPCESGSVLRADAGSGDLSFVSVRGPRAKELLKAKITVPAGEGFAGFCASEGVSVAISDVQKDPRFYANVSEKVDYETKSLLCSPMMTHGRSFGCIQLINRKGGPQFLEPEVGVLTYLSHQAALYLNNRV